ncbi:hypothetical protein LTS08_000215 [Lithohypha guttulata]|nr:hypothetical protein LTS08_000215 [Lithohypha guttulata]
MADNETDFLPSGFGDNDGSGPNVSSIDRVPNSATAANQPSRKRSYDIAASAAVNNTDDGQDNTDDEDDIDITAQPSGTQAPSGPAASPVTMEHEACQDHWTAQQETEKPKTRYHEDDVFGNSNFSSPSTLYETSLQCPPVQAFMQSNNMNTTANTFSNISAASFAVPSHFSSKNTARNTKKSRPARPRFIKKEREADTKEVLISFAQNNPDSKPSPALEQPQTNHFEAVP